MQPHRLTPEGAAPEPPITGPFVKGLDGVVRDLFGRVVRELTGLPRKDPGEDRGLQSVFELRHVLAGILRGL